MFGWLDTIFRFVCVFLLGMFSSTSGLCQTSTDAPLVLSGNRLFALGAPRVVGAFSRIYGVRWRKDGGAVAFFGLSRLRSPIAETKALLRGEIAPLQDEPGLFVYDFDTSRLNGIGKFQALRDKEYFLTAEWVGLNLYVVTGVPPTAEVPEPNKRLYVYDLKAGRASLVEELSVSGTLEASHEDAPFLIERFIEDKSQRFRVIADGKAIPLKPADDMEAFGLCGWSVDGKAYYIQGEQTIAGGTALEVRYEAGEVKVKRVTFNGRRDLFAAQLEAEPLLTLRSEKTFPSPGLISLVGRGKEAPANDARTPVSTRYDLALSANSNGDFSLSPRYTALIFVAQETLFVQRIAELSEEQKAIALTRRTRSK